MSDKLIVSGPLPPSSNGIYYTDFKTRTRHLTKEAKAYRERLQWALKQMKADELCPEPPFSVHYHFRFPDLRRRDLSNMVKLTEDSIFKWLGYDDTHVYDFHPWKYIDRRDPGMVVEIRHCSRELEASS